MKKIFYSMMVLLLSGEINANNIQITNVTVLSTTNQIQFDISWDNSWRSDVLQNWDAVWVFMKFRDVDGLWHQFGFANSNNVVPAGYIVDIGTDPRGAFLYRIIAGSGTSIITAVKLGIPSAYALGVYDIKVFGIEMVYIPTGSFWMGDAILSNNSYADYSNFSIPSRINGPSAVFKDPFVLSPFTSISSPFPSGYSNFYCMKYEISQGAYRDFLNTLSYLQQTSRTANLPNSVIGTNALTNLGTGRPYIEIATPGVFSTTPAVYGCDANNNNVFNEPGDGEWVACNYLSWPDLAAYLSWACLAPMTEMQFEKICRGPQQPLAGEFVWGNTQVSNNIYALSNAGLTNETISNLSANPSEGNASYLTTNATVLGPLLTGIFATATSNRISSGGGFYGVMDMGGSMWERVVTTATPEGRAFDGSNGIGTLSSFGNGGSSSWPGGPTVDGTQNALGLIYRGGSSHWAASYMRISDRSILETGPANVRFIDQGGRGVRNLQ